MDVVNWDAAAQLHERDDAGSDMFVEFKTLKSGSLGALVAHLMALPPGEKARLIIDASGVGSLNINDITALAARADFPAA